MNIEPGRSPKTEAAVPTSGHSQAYPPVAKAEKQANEASLRHIPTMKWRQKLRAAIKLHPPSTHFVDDSRESVYKGRGE